MYRKLLAAATVLAFTGAAAAQEFVRPSGSPPLIYMARAVEKDGKVEVLLTLEFSLLVPKTIIIEVNGKKVEKKVTEVAQKSEEKAVQIRSVTRKDGKKVEFADLPRLLQKQTAVVVSWGTDPSPEYLQILRDDALIIRAQRPSYK